MFYRCQTVVCVAVFAEFSSLSVSFSYSMTKDFPVIYQECTICKAKSFLSEHISWNRM